jgi:transcriptional regulator with XRE-family HTH domain
MAIFDFELLTYFEGYRYITSMAKYLRIKNKMTRIKVSQDLKIPITSYRRLEEDRNYKNESSIKKVANYFNIAIDIDKDLILKVNDDFNEFYNCTFFGDIVFQQRMYNKLMLNYEQCKDNILLIPLLLAKLIYYISNIKFNENKKEIEEIISILDNFYDDMTLPHKIIYNSYVCGYHAYFNQKSEMEDLAFNTMKLAETDEALKTVIIYQLSINYYFLKDWSTSLYYAIKARDGLVYTNNFNRLLYLKFHMATIFYLLSNFTEALDTLDKILVWTSFNQNDRLDYNSSLLTCYCLLRMGKYPETKNRLTTLYNRNSTKGELVMFMLYVYYKLDEKENFEQHWKLINDIYQNDMLYEGYYNISSFINLLYQHNKSDIRKNYKNLEKDFNLIPFCNLVDIIKAEYERITVKN